MSTSGPTPPVAPGRVIGILGGGQLGRMLALAAAPLGYRVHIFCPEADSPASHVAAFTTQASYSDSAALAAFAAQCDVVTYEFENIPLATVDAVAALTPVRPGRRSLEIAQNRMREKQFAREIGLETTAFAEIAAEADLTAVGTDVPGAAILKSQTLGYDGKGQVRIAGPAELAGAWRQLGDAPAILEAMVDFACEVSVLTARSVDGRTADYGPIENRHRAGILSLSRVPADVPEAVAAKARQIGVRVAEGLGHIGVLCVELFVTRDGRLLVNEIAPRVHNSGHWTIEASETDQFTQHVRAICGLPLGAPDLRRAAVMRNLIGGDVSDWQDYLGQPGDHLHLYGKQEARAGRKMGHVTRCYPLDEASPAWPPGWSEEGGAGG